MILCCSHSGIPSGSGFAVYLCLLLSGYMEKSLCLSSLSGVSNIRPLWMKCGSPKVWKTVINRELLFHQLRWVRCHAFRVFQFSCGCMNGNSDLFRYFHLLVQESALMFCLNMCDSTYMIQNYKIFTPKLFIQSPVLNFDAISE